MSRYQKDDIVLSKKFEVSWKICISPDKVSREPYIDDTWFNRKAVISKTYKEYMDKVLGGDYEDTDEYEVTFLDNGNSLAWVDGNDLILISRRTD